TLGSLPLCRPVNLLFINKKENRHETASPASLPSPFGGLSGLTCGVIGVVGDGEVGAHRHVTVTNAVTVTVTVTGRRGVLQGDRANRVCAIEVEVHAERTERTRGLLQPPC